MGGELKTRIGAGNSTVKFQVWAIHYRNKLGGKQIKLQYPKDCLSHILDILADLQLESFIH